MALSAPERVPNTIACVNRDGLETTVNWMIMNVSEVDIPYFSKIPWTMKELKQYSFLFVKAFLYNKADSEIKSTPQVEGQ